MSTVTVVLCSFNGSKYIVDQLQTICSQSMKPDEIIVSDDASDDGTLELVREVAGKHSEIAWTLIENTVNRGWRVNFFEAIAEAGGDYVCLADQDDLWRAEHISSMVRILEARADVTLVVSRATPFYEEESVRSPLKVVSDNGSGAMSVNTFVADYLSLAAPGCTYCFRRSLFVEIAPYWSPEFAHDGFLYAFANLREQLAELDYVTVDSRRHSANASDIRKKGRAQLNDEIDGMIKMHDALLSFAVGCACLNLDAKVRMLEASRAWLVKRKGIINSGNPLAWSMLIPSFRMYPSIRSLLGDLWCTIFKTRLASR